MADTPQYKGLAWVTMGLLGLATLGVTGLHIFAPTNTLSSAPRQIESTPAQDVADLSDQNGLGPSAGALNGEFSVDELHARFASLGYDLAPVLEGVQDVPRLFMTRLPHDLAALKQSNERKEVFFKTLLPLVLKINEDITKDRARIWRMKHRLDVGLGIKTEERVWVQGMFMRFGVKDASLETLLTRVDVVPPSLALAQAAEESGWGTSRFVREGNALFGQWTFNPNDKGIVPKGREEGKTHRIRAFDSLFDSLKAYVHNLNTHKAYAKLRTKRIQMREGSNALNGHLLATALDKYSERGEQYVISLQSLMDQNDLGRFDGLKLDEGQLKDASAPLI